MLYEFTLTADVDPAKVDGILADMHGLVCPVSLNDDKETCAALVASAIPIIVCRFCDADLHKDNGTWVDETEGDGCSGDDNLINESGVHTPT